MSLKTHFKKIKRLFERRDYLYREKLTNLTTSSQIISEGNAVEQELIKEISNLEFVYQGEFRVPETFERLSSKKTITSVEHLNSILFHFDSFDRKILKKFTHGNSEAMKILEIWRRLYCSVVPVKFYYLDASFDNKYFGMSRGSMGQKMISYNKITTTNREKSLQTLKKIIATEFEKYQETKHKDDPRLIINEWDYRDLKNDLIEITPNVFIEYGMFPGEFRIELSNKIKPFVEEVGHNIFRLNHKHLLEFNKWTESFSPREFCAPKSFYSEYRNLKTNTFIFFWYSIKKAVHSLFTTLSQWHTTITLIMTIAILITKK